MYRIRNRNITVTRRKHCKCMKWICAVKFPQSEQLKAVKICLITERGFQLPKSLTVLTGRCRRTGERWTPLYMGWFQSKIGVVSRVITATGIGVGRIRTFPFSSHSAYDSVVYDLEKTRLSDTVKQKGKYKPITRLVSFVIGLNLPLLLATPTA